MDNYIFKRIESEQLVYILDGDPRLKIFEYISSIAQKSKRFVNMEWPQRIWDHYSAKGRITHNQFNILVDVYEREWALEEAHKIRETQPGNPYKINSDETEEEKVIQVKFA